MKFSTQAVSLLLSAQLITCCVPSSNIDSSVGTVTTSIEESDHFHESFDGDVDTSCPPWYLYNQSDGSCTQGKNHHDILKFDQERKSTGLLDCYCMTYNHNLTQGYTGACFYNCVNLKLYDQVYLELNNVTSVTKTVCGHLNREGTLCGKCIEDYSPLVYSFNLACVPCPDGKRNWWKFVLAAFVPLTIFYLFVLFFKISATSSHLHAFVIFSQAIAMPANIRILLQAVESDHRKLKALEIVASFYGIWNLDFFRALLPNICLRTNSLQTLSLDYAVAVYPLFLMMLSYFLIELHDRNFKVIVFIWRPFRTVLTLFRRNWDIRTSVIDAYATFFVLSYVKFLSVSFDLLAPTHLYNLRHNSKTVALYYDATIPYFGKEHRPYAILALSLLLVFVFIPTVVLFLYPFRWFQKFLNCFPIRWHILHTFVDSFQGCYKDGTEPGTRDCRIFASFYLLARIVFFIIFSLTLGVMFYVIAIVVLLLMAMVIFVFQPYKLPYHTKINATLIILLLLFYTAIISVNIASIKSHRSIRTCYIFVEIFGGLPLIYISCIVIHWVFSRRKWGTEFVQRVQAWRQGYEWWSEALNSESLPDRLVHPEQYSDVSLNNSLDSVDGYQAIDGANVSYTTY